MKRKSLISVTAKEVVGRIQSKPRHPCPNLRVRAGFRKQLALFAHLPRKTDISLDIMFRKIPNIFRQLSLPVFHKTAVMI